MTVSEQYAAFIYKSRYSRWLYDLKRRENWDESVDRYMKFFSPRIPAKFRKNVIKELHDGLKVLGSGELKNAVTVKAHLFSGSAKTKIESKGGQAVLLGK